MTVLDIAPATLATSLISMFFWTMTFKQTTKTKHRFMVRFLISHVIAAFILLVAAIVLFCITKLSNELVLPLSLKLLLHGMYTLFITAALLGLVGLPWKPTELRGMGDSNRETQR